MAAIYYDTITTPGGAVISGALVQVYNALGALVTLYIDKALTTPVTPIPTQVITDNTGYFQFYLPDGTYTVTQSYGGATRTIPDVELYDFASIRGGVLQSGVWVKLPAIYALILNGTGSVTIDTKTRAGTVTTGAASYSPSGSEIIDYPYFGAAADQVRATLTGTATAEII